MYLALKSSRNMFTFEAVYLLSFEEPLGMIESGNEHVLMHWMEETTASLIIAVLVPLARKTFYRMPGAWADKYRAVHKTKKVCRPVYVHTMNKRLNRSVVLRGAHERATKARRV
jgi:hypothetical protein